MIFLRGYLQHVNDSDYVFISIALLILGFVGILTIRDWVTTRRLSSRAVFRVLKRISQSVSLQEWEKAEKDLSKLIANGKGGKEAALFEVQVLRGTNRLQEALHKAKANSHLYPEELLFRLEEGKILFELARYKEALDSFQVCLPILRSEPDLVYLASALKQVGCNQECYDIINPLLSTTQNERILQLAGDALYDLKLFPAAIGQYKRAIETGCESHHLFTQLGHAFRRLGNLAEAEKIFRRLLEKDPRDIDAILGLGACLQERGHHNKALLVYQSGFIAKDIRLVRQAAYAALHAKRYRFAEIYFSELLQQQKHDAQTMAYFGFCLESQKKWQEAEQIYLKLIQFFPDAVQGFRALAWMFGVGLSQTVTHEQGMHYAHRALKLKNDSLSWEILSACFARTGVFDKAYQIQLGLAKQDSDQQTRLRRQQALRCLRKKIPLGDQQVIRSMVA